MFTLPRAERFERMRGDDQRRAMQHLGEIAGQACIPGVGVDDVGIDQTQSDRAGGRVLRVHRRASYRLGFRRFLPRTVAGQACTRGSRSCR